MNQLAKRTIFSLARKPIWHLPSRSALPIPQHEAVDEEMCPGYSPNHFYSANPGDILASHYQLLVKIGWGTRSTVWLARDITRLRWQSERTVALKIIDSCRDREPYHERDIEEHITRQNPSHRGRAIVRTCLESFEVASTEGNHLCLAYKPMREPLWILQRRFVDRRLPLPIVKAYIFFLLVGLDFLHSDCGVVHTDLKLDNILMSFENESVLSAFVKLQINEVPMQYKVDIMTGRTVYRCHNDFGALDWTNLKNMPDHYRAPEVILGCGWDSKADIWNFGVMMWNIIECTELFQQVHNTDGRYDSKSHLAEMIALLGPPPEKLIAKENAMAQHNWPHPISNEAGISCSNAREYFDGPFFSDEGKFLYDDLIPARSLEATLPSLEENERDSFLSFVRGMLTWLPEERKTARQLIAHPFLNIKK
ncbi:hypothetical protein CBS147332_9241 [Penicillium roqueforti]|nr:hypothetical protein CBS147332_9241 [Penicillium roqueforti]KAI3103728.1 hypothetical protein CBS147331_7332 [Penicillium roqueforti]